MITSGRKYTTSNEQERGLRATYHDHADIAPCQDPCLERIRRLVALAQRVAAFFLDTRHDDGRVCCIIVRFHQ